MDKVSISEWKTALSLMGRWQSGHNHLDVLLETLDPGRSHWLVMEVFRNWLLIDSILKQQTRRDPRPRTRNLLRLAVAEMLNREPEKYSRIIHHAVETGKAIDLSQGECGFVNAVLRAISRNQAVLNSFDISITHPAWLVQRWENQFGQASARKLIEWNQMVPGLIIRAQRCPEYANTTRWDGFFEIRKGGYADAAMDLKQGRVYMQDPFTRIPVDLLSAQPGECILDLCAAPGGKTRLLAEALSGTGMLLAVDKPGPRLLRLQENLKLLSCNNIRILGKHVEELEEADLEKVIDHRQADAVMIDVPCSNTGVIQKRPDVKLRLEEDQFQSHASRQSRLLRDAARLVRPGGRLVYSTCSIDTEENASVVEAFLQINPNWELAVSRISYPWDCEHDGGAAFLLTKSHTK